jgi:hypothetical protein
MSIARNKHYHTILFPAPKQKKRHAIISGGTMDTRRHFKDKNVTVAAKCDLYSFEKDEEQILDI